MGIHVPPPQPIEEFGSFVELAEKAVDRAAAGAKAEIKMAVLDWTIQNRDALKDAGLAKSLLDLLASL